MRLVKVLSLLMIMVSFSMVSCSVEDDLLTENPSEVLESDPPNQDDDPVIEDPKG